MEMLFKTIFSFLLTPSDQYLSSLNIISRGLGDKIIILHWENYYVDFHFQKQFGESSEYKEYEHHDIQFSQSLLIFLLFLYKYAQMTCEFQCTWCWKSPLKSHAMRVGVVAQ